MKRMNSLLRLILTIVILLTSVTGFAQQRSMDEVMRIAQNHMSQRTTKTGKRLAPPAEKATTLRASEILPQPLRMHMGEAFYVLSYPKSNCFVMVSGDERMSPVLAYSDERAFDLDNMAPQTKAFLETYVAQAEALQSGAPRKLDLLRAPAVTPQKINPLLTTTWSQRMPYNNRCPLIGSRRTITGCVATALSQMMNYYQYPKVGIGSVSYTSEKENLSVYADLSTLYFDWNKMLDSYEYGEYDDAQADAVAKLMFATGAAVHMDYGLDASSSNLSDAAAAVIKHFKYDKDITEIEFDRMTTPMVHQFIMQELIAGRPIPCSGSNADNSGHAFILDGMTPDGDDYPFYHFNWGWGGLDDGEYKLPNIEYFQGNKILIYFQPENDSIDIANFVQAASIEPSAHKVNPKQTGNITVRMKEVCNGKQGTFNGMLNIYIVDSEGTRTKIGERGVQLEFSYFYAYEISCKVPNDLSLGTYTLEVDAQDLATNTETPVYFAEQDAITITDEAVDYVPNMQATKMEFVKGAMNDSTVCVALTNFLNFSAEPFKGHVSLALTTENDRLICMLGEPVKPTTIYERYINYSNPLPNLKGVVPDSVPDDVYHVVVMARQEGFEGWGLVKKFDLQGNSIRNAGQDLFLTIQIEDGKIKTDNIVVPQKFFADIETTEMTLNKEKCKGRFFSITISDLANIGEETFSGNISLALADDENNVVLAFGNPKTIAGAQPFYMQNGFTLEGELPDTVSDGHYRLCLAAQQQGYSNWTPLTMMVIEDYTLTETNLECFFDLWVINGQPTFNLYKREDVNHDGIVDTQDVLAIYLFMQNATGEETNPVEDVNGDGVVDTQDVLTIYTYMQEN